jgi:hypothetical protein
VVDDGAATGALAGQEWVNIPNTNPIVQIMKYEASRPDATSTDPGVKSVYPCSRAGVQPWTMVKQPQAEAACALVGGRLCTEQEWHRACSVVTGTTWPIAQVNTGDAAIYIEAEDYVLLTPKTSTGTAAAPRTWVPDYTIQPGTPTVSYSGISAMRASPDTGVRLSLATSLAQGPRLDYTVNFTQTGNTYVWVKMLSTATSNDELNVGISTTPNATAPTTTITNSSVATVWTWVRAGPFNIPAVGTRAVSLYMREDGMRIDALYITRNTGTTAPTSAIAGNGGDWSFASSPDVYAGSTCNGKDNDSDTSTPGTNDDGILGGGVKTQCYANQSAGSVFDMSGNVKEWTAERIPDENPIRGGASNNLGGGMTCANAFSLANDNFFFNNVGFRCCK